MIQVIVQWTATARKLLLQLPKPIQKGLVRKIGDLRDSDPRKAGKALIGPLSGYRSITHGRYRAIFGVQEERQKNRNVILRVRVHVEVVGIRREHDKRDVYKVAQKLVELGLIPAQEIPESESDEA